MLLLNYATSKVDDGGASYYYDERAMLLDLIRSLIITLSLDNAPVQIATLLASSVLLARSLFHQPLARWQDDAFGNVSEPIYDLIDKLM
jgi:hypothetical protein